MAASKCPNYGKRTREYSMDDIEEFYKRLHFGDIIVIKRTLYNHWVVYVQNETFGRAGVEGDHLVVHINGNSYLGSYSGGNGNAAVVEPLIDVVGNSKFYINNEYDFDENPNPPSFIQIRLENELECLRKEYNLFNYNCEHFATLIRNNKPKSVQLEDKAIIIGIGSALVGAWNFLFFK
uniref:HRAS-like suppressor 3 n=1 Tax=Caligus rogercresseyi TaxID=217165 RepID=C1BPN4_CALRO|nr:HRAS-like suppressor 3 [Caligus rogercresseyi]